MQSSGGSTGTAEGGRGLAAFVRPKTAQQAVLHELRQQIVSGGLPPGSAIRQDELAERYQVSRVPVREALKMLEGEGYVSYTPHHGFRVTQLSIAELIEIYSMRRWIETGLLQAGVPLLTEKHERAMREAMDLMVGAVGRGDVVAVNEQNRRFHFQLLEPSGMERALRTLEQLYNASDPYRSLYFEQHYTPETVNAEHELILAAALAGDVEETVRLMDSHRGTSVGRLQKLLDDGR